MYNKVASNNNGNEIQMGTTQIRMGQTDNWNQRQHQNTNNAKSKYKQRQLGFKRNELIGINMKHQIGNVKEIGIPQNDIQTKRKLNVTQKESGPGNPNSKQKGDQQQNIIKIKKESKQNREWGIRS